MEVTKSPAASRKEREKAARRNAMLHAAQAVFAEKGYAHATLEEIAARAEFGKGTLYNYFAGGKEEILFALLDRLYDGILEIIEKHFSIREVSLGNIRSVVRNFLEHTFRFLSEQDDLFLIAIKEAHRYLFGDDQDKTDYFRRQRDRIVDALTPPIEYAMKQGTLKSLSPAAVAHMLFGNINGCYTHVCLCNRFGTPEASAPHSASDNAEFITTILFDGLTVRKETSANGR